MAHRRTPSAIALARKRRTSRADARQGNAILTKHISVVLSLCWRSFLFVAASDASISVWDMYSGLELAVLTDGIKGKASGMAVAGGCLFTGGSDGRLASWQLSSILPSGKAHSRRASAHSIVQAEDDDEEPVAALSAAAIAQFPAAVSCITAVEQWTSASQHGDPDAAEERAGFLAVGFEDGAMTIVQAEDLAVVATFEAHESRVQQLLHSRKHGLLFSSSGRRVRGWQVGTYARALKIKTKAPVGEMVAKGGLLYLCAGAEVHAHSIKSRKPSHTLAGHAAAVSRIRVTKEWAFTGAEDGTIRQWSAATGECVAVFVGHLLAVRDFVVTVGDARVPSSRKRSHDSALYGASSRKGGREVTRQRSDEGTEAADGLGEEERERGGPRRSSASAVSAAARHRRKSASTVAAVTIASASEDTTWRLWRVSAADEAEESGGSGVGAWGTRSMDCLVAASAKRGIVRAVPSPADSSSSASPQEEERRSSATAVVEMGSDGELEGPPTGRHSARALVWESTPRGLSDGSDCGSGPAVPPPSPHKGSGGGGRALVLNPRAGGRVLRSPGMQHRQRSPRYVALANRTQDSGLLSDGYDSCASASGDELPYSVPCPSPKRPLGSHRHTPVPEAAATILAVNAEATLSPARPHSNA